MVGEVAEGSAENWGWGVMDGVVRTSERRESGLLGRRGGGKREKWLRKYVVRDRSVADRVE